MDQYNAPEGRWRQICWRHTNAFIVVVVVMLSLLLLLLLLLLFAGPFHPSGIVFRIREIRQLMEAQTMRLGPFREINYRDLFVIIEIWPTTWAHLRAKGYWRLSCERSGNLRPSHNRPDLRPPLGKSSIGSPCHGRSRFGKNGFPIYLVQLRPLGPD